PRSRAHHRRRIVVSRRSGAVSRPRTGLTLLLLRQPSPPLHDVSSDPFSSCGEEFSVLDHVASVRNNPSQGILLGVTNFCHYCLRNRQLDSSPIPHLPGTGDALEIQFDTGGPNFCVSGAGLCEAGPGSQTPATEPSTKGVPCGAVTSHPTEPNE